MTSDLSLEISRPVALKPSGAHSMAAVRPARSQVEASKSEVSATRTAYRSGKRIARAKRWACLVTVLNASGASDPCARRRKRRIRGVSPRRRAGKMHADAYRTKALDMVDKHNELVIATTRAKAPLARRTNVWLDCRADVFPEHRGHDVRQSWKEMREVFADGFRTRLWGGSRVDVPQCCRRFTVK